MKIDKKILAVAVMFGLVMFWSACTDVNYNPLDQNAPGHVPEWAMDDNGNGIPNYYDDSSPWYLGGTPQSSDTNGQNSSNGEETGDTPITGSNGSVVSSAPRGSQTSSQLGSGIITLHGPNPFHLRTGANYNEPGYSATDVDGSNITSDVFVNRSDLDNTFEGIYTITYTVEDAAGNNILIERAVIVNPDSTSTYTPSTSSSAESSVAVSSEAVSSEAVSSEAVSSEAVSSEAVSSEAVSSEVVSSEAVSSEVVSSSSSSVSDGDVVAFTQQDQTVSLTPGTHEVSININWGDPGKTTGTLSFQQSGQLTVSGEVGGVDVSTAGAVWHHSVGVPTNGVTGTITVDVNCDVSIGW